MAKTLAQLNVLLSLKKSKFERDISRVSRNLGNLGQTLATRVTLPLIGLGAAAVKSAADFETLETSFGVLLGSAEKAKDLFNQLKEFSAKTPFQLKDIARAAQAMLGVGSSVQEVNDTLQYMGDISAVTGANLNDLVIKLAQAKSVGKVFTRDLREFANRGIPIFTILQEHLGVTGEELDKLTTSGQVTFEILTDALRGATKEGGLFFGGMEKGSKTLNGLLSTLRDNVNIAFAEFGEAIVESGALKDVIADLTSFVKKLTDRFRQLTPEQQKNIIKWAGITAAIGPVLFVLSQITSSIGALITLFASLTRTIVLFAQALLGAGVAGGGLQKILLLLAGGIRAIILALGPWGAVIAGIGIAFIQARKHSDEFRESTDKLGESISNTLDKFIDWFSETKIGQAVFRGQKTSANEYKDVLDELSNSFEALTQKQHAFFKDSMALSKGIDIIGGVVDESSIKDNLKASGLFKDVFPDEKNEKGVVVDKLRSLNEQLSDLERLRNNALFSGHIESARGFQNQITALQEKLETVPNFLTQIERESEKDWLSLESLTPRISKIGELFSLAKTGARDFADQVVNLGQRILEQTPLFDRAMSFIQSIGAEFKNSAQFDEFIARFSSLTDVQQKVLANFGDIASTTQDMFSGAFNAMLSGQNVIKGFFDPLKQLAKKLAAAAISAGILSFLLGGLNLGKVVGIAGNFKALFSGFTGLKLARGGAVKKQTLAMIGDNPSGKEAVIPFERMGEFIKMALGGMRFDLPNYNFTMPKAQTVSTYQDSPFGQVVFRIQGSDLIGVIENSGRDMQRIRGYNLTR